ncbi:Cold-shock DEAD box protein A [Mannheimia haemolytica]|uniref:Cold-shock DEAD box protein A n=1 Tax=Mannheimia haemolytica TaxID=75985 RepID=A0A378N5I9_MANHA|nr:Cold-shock DEAD box protein A [Mannheimia haemolytica]
MRAARSERGRDRNERNDRRNGREHRENNGVAMDLYRIELGREDGVEVRHIVGAIANEGISAAVTSGISNFMINTQPLSCRKECQIISYNISLTKQRVLSKPMQMTLLALQTVQVMQIHLKVVVAVVTIVMIVVVAETGFQ